MPKVDGCECPDIHEYIRRMERALKRLKDHPKISGENKCGPLKYLGELEDGGYSLLYVAEKLFDDWIEWTRVHFSGHY
ncbi:MAG: hypothetical protein QW638_07585 [Candidatus Bathyarchaeia archaeon]